jgi:hypothetical protein
MKTYTCWWGWVNEQRELTWHFIVAISLTSRVSSTVGLFDRRGCWFEELILVICLFVVLCADGRIYKSIGLWKKKELSLEAEASLL